jgi:hypothetical protein
MLRKQSLQQANSMSSSWMAWLSLVAMLILRGNVLAPG